MIKLATREEQIMQVFWDLERAFIRDIIPLLPDPKPHYNSVATMVKILEEKGFLDHEAVGNVYQYFPIISREKSSQVSTSTSPPSKGRNCASEAYLAITCFAPAPPSSRASSVKSDLLNNAARRSSRHTSRR